MVGILEVTVAPESGYLVREHALIRVRTATRELAGLLDIAALYQASVLEELPSELVLEVTAAPPAMVSFLRALEPFGVLDVVRGGAVALPHAVVSESAGRTAAPAQRVATAIPA
jgi:acetolactate synthase-1/3 small subunit